MFKRLIAQIEGLKDRKPEKLLLIILAMIAVIILWIYLIFFMEPTDKAEFSSNNRLKQDLNFEKEKRSDKIDSKQEILEQLATKSSANSRQSPFKPVDKKEQSKGNDDRLFVYQLDNESKTKESKAVKDLVDEELKLLGIISRAGTKLALIEVNGEVKDYRSGAELGDYLVSQIKKEQVILRAESILYSLKFK